VQVHKELAGSQKNNETRQAKKKALDVVFSQIDKQWGKGSVMLLGQQQHTIAEDAIPTGSIQIDHALGIGGFARGRIVEIYGPEASGKTTIALQVVAQAQNQGGICAFIDAEHALDPVYAEKLGIHVHDLIISQPDFGEQALDIAEMLIRSGAVDVIVIDSVAALVPKAELDGDMGDTHVGLQARLMSQALRKLTPVVHKSKTVLIFINQVRQNISAAAFAPKETTTGGNALKFYSSLRLDVRRIESLKTKDGVQYGNRVAVKVAKNKLAPPFRKAEVVLVFGKGIDKTIDLIDAALGLGIITQSGSWFYLDDKKLSQGKDGLIAALEAQSELSKAIYERVKRGYQEVTVSASPAVPEIDVLENE
jgi:recombination protein RecA